ncbi:phosphomannomutase/phosphoglucomutase [Candidatus Woesearchaeota archaeon CG_4_10_14_0_2_um_filter_33_10]|nr:MAG: phosphomannomutase/phosphoglucomutase [Candidatus Woesearchaeota archaeon CG10_big_fil_rev_8_21_14_0_10_33_12]PIU72979.1 MAG: phosphomannomutase/phosphoglucomutase [Candidatus Woesearchaeota archaeon CG06_land_8_20_14_3_00_33_13]PIZ53681.1 MAG: phosphomannomutase/phosphoglucomutase [Candidatus Woesearchaeota archaeon CG_4_10_14_0_2_um_filter_33_10]
MSIFKAYDVRGIYPEQLNEKIAYKIGRAFVEFLKCKNVVIGRDMRLSSGSLFKALAKGVTDQGADVIEIGLSATPMLYFSVANYGFDSGLMVTASHNPKEWNGIKFTREKAIPISEATGIKEIEKLVEKNDFEEHKKGRIIKKDVLKNYVDFVLSFVDVRKIKPLKVVMDASNGMAGMIAPKVFEKTGIDIIPMYFELDGSFPNHQSNPLILENRQDIMKKVVEEKADLGIAWDGDADRCFFIDEKGRFLQGDFITGLLAENMLKKHPNSMILYDLRASWFVKDIIKKNNGKSRMCRVGHSFFKQYMRDENAVFAGEVTGHYYYKYKDFYTDNGMIPALQMMELISEKSKPFSEILKIADKYFISGEINSDVYDKEAVMKKLEQEFSDGKISHMDGISVDYDDWHFNVRPSNTEPLLRLNLEAKTKEKMEEMRDKVLHIIKG